MASAPFSQRIQIELIKLLYQQIDIALWAESIAAIALFFTLWGAVDERLLSAWLFFILIFSGLGRHLLVYFYRRNLRRTGYSYKAMWTWLILFGVGVFISGLSWGAIGSILMVKDDILRQTFNIFLLVGVTAAANPFYSPIRSIYLVFLVPAFVPFTFYLLSQGGIFVVLSLLSLVYIFIMLATSMYLHRLIYNSLRLRFENLDLVDNLSNAKHTLENRTEALEKSLSLVRATLESTTDGILVVNEHNEIEDYNRKFAEMWDLPSHLYRSRDLVSLISYVVSHLENPRTFQEKMHNLARNSEEESFDELILKDGRIFERYSHPQHIGDRPVGRVWSFRDVTGRKFMEARLFHQANFDSLTGLPNRALLLDRALQALASAKSLHVNMAILFLDLDRFKVINDSLGHTVADKLLIGVAKRLIASVDKNATVSREGGDEFIIILNTLENEADIIEIAGNILHAIREPFLIDGHKLNITISIGISFFPKDGQDVEMLIRNADIAMYHAKMLGRNNFQFFTEEMNRKVMERLVLENQLRDALEQNELSLVYQPIVSLKSGKVVALEALLRWRHPKTISVAPADFISLAEETGVIVQIGEWVLHTVCKQAKEWRRAGFNDLQIGVNLSARQFRQVNFLDQIRKIMRENDFDPQRLSLELTESILMDDVDKTIVVLQQLKEMGITIIIDDFGTGYSSLNYLKQLPVDKLKIDRSFIQDIPKHSDDVAITAAIIALAARLNLKVIAEGVENESQLNFLLEHNCDEIQGFYFSEPLELEDCLKLLQKNKARMVW